MVLGGSRHAGDQRESRGLGPGVAGAGGRAPAGCGGGAGLHRALGLPSRRGRVGGCACCSLRAAPAANGGVHVLSRNIQLGGHRPMNLLYQPLGIAGVGTGELVSRRLCRAGWKVRHSSVRPGRSNG